LRSNGDLISIATVDQVECLYTLSGHNGRVNALAREISMTGLVVTLHADVNRYLTAFQLEDTFPKPVTLAIC
jgi:hypothetical protein